MGERDAARAWVRLAQLLALLPLAAAFYGLIVCAWQCDDAYITFRTVRNFWEGHGLRWNVDERVQAYTHPLWMLLSLGVYGVTRELFFSMTAVAIALGMLALGLLAQLSESRARFAVSTLVLVGSCAFLEFNVCGLENPLLNVLVVACALASRAPPSARAELWRALGLSAVYLTRADAVLLVGPLWLWSAVRGRAHWRSMLLGLMPVVAWQVFSLVYYGALVPNTALAKLNVELPLSRLALAGVGYFADSLRHDPLTLIATAGAIVYAVLLGRAREQLLALGVVLYLAYVVRIGGDFMSGRFFGAPLLAAVCAANMAAGRGSMRPLQLRVWTGLAVLVAVYALAWPRAPLRSTLGFGAGYQVQDVGDERAVYYHWHGLLPVLVRYPELRENNLPVPWAFNVKMALEFAASNKRIVAIDSVGYFGFHARDKVVIDTAALADPLLSRIRFVPADGKFRIGHFKRELPQGYLETRVLGRNLLTDPGLHAAYDDIMLVTQAPLLTPGRWAAMWRLNTGFHSVALGGNRHGT